MIKELSKMAILAQKKEQGRLNITQICLTSSMNVFLDILRVKILYDEPSRLKRF